MNYKGQMSSTATIDNIESRTTEAGATERHYEEKEIDGRWYYRDPTAKDMFGKQGRAQFPFDEGDYARKLKTVTATHASLVAEVGRLRGATEAALNLLRRFRDEKPKQWDAIVDADACDVWDSLVAALRSGGE